ncbi:MAG TPA: hypothetical protein VGM37_21575 [Armatimonadota bacterium]
MRNDECDGAKARGGGRAVPWNWKTWAFFASAVGQGIGYALVFRCAETRARPGALAVGAVMALIVLCSTAVHWGWFSGANGGRRALSGGEFWTILFLGGAAGTGGAYSALRGFNPAASRRMVGVLAVSVAAVAAVSRRREPGGVSGRVR